MPTSVEEVLENTPEAEAPALEEGEAEAEASDEAATEDEALAGEGDEPALEEMAARDYGRFQPIADLVEAGGFVIIILGVLSIISLMVIVVKLVQFSIMRVTRHGFVKEAADLLHAGREQEALDFVERQHGVIARIMEIAIRGRMVKGENDAAREEVERVAKAKLDGMERGLPLLSLIATVSPLLGLLGTVLGMIAAFQQLEGAGDRVDPAILSGGIWEALLTTAAGLSVAIPAAAFYTWLQRAVDVSAQYMEDAAIRVFTSALYETAEREEAGEADESASTHD